MKKHSPRKVRKKIGTDIKMTKYIAIWTEIGDGGGRFVRTAVVESEDDSLAVITALREYGMDRDELESSTIYRVEHGWSGKQLLGAI